MTLGTSSAPFYAHTPDMEECRPGLVIFAPAGVRIAAV